MGQIADAAFDWYVRRLTARHFAGVHINAPADTADAEGARMAMRAPSLLLVANHTNWWDGFLAWLVSRRLGLRFHILMEAANLDRYWMFRWIGALPMHRGQLRQAYRDLRSAGEWLQQPAQSLWIFPQGERRSAALSIRETEQGAALLALQHQVAIIPVAFRYAFLGEQLPEAFIELGEAFHPEGNQRMLVAREMENRLQQAVDSLDAKLGTEQFEGFDLLLQGKLSINKRLDRVRHAAGTIDGPFERRNG